MAKNRVKKESEISRYVKELQAAKSIVFADLSKLKVNESNELRRQAGKEAIGIVAAKKTLLRLALKKAKIEGVDVANLPGSVSLLLGTGDEVAPAKVLVEFSKKHENLSVLGGLLEAKLMSADEIKALAKLPNKQQLLAQVVATINAPLSGLVGVLQGTLRSFVYALAAIKDTKSA